MARRRDSASLDESSLRGSGGNAPAAQPREREPLVLVHTAEGVRELAEAARRGGWIAVDTEFMREKTYYPELALVQLGVEGAVGLIDPLAGAAPAMLEELALLFADAAVTKIIHAAGQDLEVLRVTLGVVPQPIFDTQVAAALAGLGGPERQVSYAALVQDLLGVELSKGSQRADWLARPLSPALLDYAADDVRWLNPLREALLQRMGAAQLDECGARCGALVEAARRGLDANALADRVKGGAKLRGPARQRLTALARWREEKARAANVPRRWLLGDEVLVALAVRAPKSVDALYGVSELPSRARVRWGAELVSLVNS